MTRERVIELEAELVGSPDYSRRRSPTIVSCTIVALVVGILVTPHPSPPVAAEVQRDKRTLAVVSRIADGDVVGAFGDIAVVGSQLVVIDTSPLDGGGHVLLIDRFTGERVGTTGQKGQGPGEYQMPVSIGTGRSASEFFVYDVAARRLTRYNAEPWTGEPVQVLRTAATPFYHPSWAGGTLVTNGAFETGLLRFFELNGEDLVPTRTMGQLPFREETPPAIAIPAAQSAMIVDPSGKHIAIGFALMSRIQIYEVSEGLLAEVVGPDEVDITADLTTAGDRFRPSPDTRFAYVDISADERFIFALFSGRYLRESIAAGGPVHTMTDQLHVFSWNGSFVGAWTLGEEISQIAAAPDGSAIYGTGSDAARGIVDFGAFPGGSARVAGQNGTW